MTKKRAYSALGLSAVCALTLSACATSGSSNNATTNDSSVSVAITNVFSSLNVGTSTGNSDTNGIISSMTNTGFYTVTDKFEVRHNDWFGTYQMSPEGEGIKVDYTVNEGQKWSDGNDIDKGDLLLAWAAISGHFNSQDEDGVQYFDYAGDSSGLAAAGKPTTKDDRSISFTYPTAFADWETVYDLSKPAHVVAELAGMTEAELVETLESATPGENNDKLTKIAEAWNTAYDTTTKPSDEKLLVGNGPYLVSDVIENQSVTLTANPNYQGSTKPAIQEVVLKVLPDAAGQVQALQNGEVDAVAPQASIDTVSQLEGLSGVVTTPQADQAYDHLDLNMQEGSPFADANVRKAFLLTVPRQDIVDKLIKPMNPDAKVLNSQLYLVSDAENYAKTVQSNNSSDYPSSDMDANIAKAKELLNGQTPTIRILYNSKNSNRVNTFQMIKESAEKAGFVVVDSGSEQWSSMLAGGDYEASIFGWVSSGVGNGTLGQIFKSGSSSNFTSYSNSTVDEAAENIMRTTDTARIEELKMQADGELFKDAYGLPLFQSVAVTSYNENLQGVKPKPGQYPLTWNIEEWSYGK